MADVYVIRNFADYFLKSQGKRVSVIAVSSAKVPTSMEPGLPCYWSPQSARSGAR